MAETDRILVDLAGIFALGMGAQWVAWRLRIPSIVLLLAFGYVAGPATGLIDPDAVFGNLLLPVVTFSVALILFEGGLSLKVDELKETGGAIWKLVSIGAFVTWILASLAAYTIMEFNWEVSLVVGAILVVTGPTVIGPLLRHIRPSRRVGAVAKWEGIVIDPIGAVLAVLVLEATTSASGEGFADALLGAGAGLARTAVVGGVAGGAVAWIALLFLKRFWVPDFLQIPLFVMSVVVVFTVSNLLQKESGLLAVTVMGIVLANQKSVAIRHIVEFKENLRVLLISAVFILLAARLKSGLTELLDWRSLSFVGVLILFIRPFAVLVSTFGSELNWRERVFLGWLAPRGIVAAAVASVFALHLEEVGEEVTGLVFLVVVMTVSVYGLTAPFLARALKISNPNPQGVLIVGAHRFSRALGCLLKNQGYQVLLADTSRTNLRKARMEGLPTYYGNILSEYALETLDLGGIGRLLALTPNDEVNTLATLHFSEVFGRSEVYQLSMGGGNGADRDSMSLRLHGRFLFGKEATYDSLMGQIRSGAAVKRTKISEEYDFDAFLSKYGQDALLLFRIDQNGRLDIFAIDDETTPKPGEEVVFLAAPSGKDS